jgi:hypothetical protein
VSGRRRPLGLVAAACACVALACSVGEGTGAATGHVVFPECRLDNPNYDLRPDFFVADFVDDPRNVTDTRWRMLDLRMQRGSYGEGSSDGIAMIVRDVDAIARTQIDVPLVVGPGQAVEMTLFLGQTCPSGLPRGDFFTVPAILEAARGTIVFHAIYAPDVDPNASRLAADFTDVHFEDAESPTTRFGVLSGNFSFFYQRGRPAQHFP